MKDLLKEFTSNLDVLPEEYRLKPVIDYTLEMLRLGGFEYDQIDPSSILVTKDKFIYSIQVTSYTKVKYAIEQLEGSPINAYTLKHYTQNTSIEDLVKFLDKIQKNHWSYISDMYDEVNGLSKKYASNPGEFSQMFNQYFK